MKRSATVVRFGHYNIDPNPWFYFVGYNYSQNGVTPMLVTDVGNQMCLRQVGHVGDRFITFKKSSI